MARITPGDLLFHLEITGGPEVLQVLGHLPRFLAGREDVDRVGGQPQRDESAIIDPLELRKLREQAAARKRELAASQAQDPGPPPA